MDSALLHSMENLQFTEEESGSVVIDSPSDEGDSSLWLVGRVITNKAVNGDSVCRIFRSVWKSKHVSEILELRPNFFLIKPVEKDSKEMILKRRPWVVHDDLFSIELYNPTWRTTDFDFNIMTIWARVYQLPLRAMNGVMGLQLGGCIGRAIGVDHRVEGGNLGEFLRIRVAIDITKPLRRCVFLSNGQGQKSSPCPLKYERLPRLCYYCGLLGHDLAVCQSIPADFDHRKLQYGSWLRVSVQQPKTGPRRKQGIEYFDTAAEPSGAPAVAAVEVPIARVGSDTGPTAAMTKEPAGNTETPASSVTAKATAVHDLINDNTTCDKHEQVLDTAAATGSNMPPPSAHVDATLHESAGTFSTHSGETLQPDGSTHIEVDLHVSAGTHSASLEEVLQPVGSTVVAPAIVPQEVAPLPSTEIRQQHGSTKGREGGVIRASKRTLQGKYEVCTPIQAKRSRMYKLSDGGCRDVRATPSSIMRIISWNCRGLGNSSTVRFLGDFVARHTPTLVFLCETRLRNSSTSRVKASLGMNNCFTVDFGNGCNGLMLLWNNEINVSLLSYSATHIDATVDSPTGSFHFTGFHGYYTESMKHLNWSLFDRLRQASPLPWLIGGDFNELICHSEKEGGRRKPRGLIENFRECLHRNDLFDCKPSSGWFTFTYSNGSCGTIRERLDRFVASPDWLSRHPFFRVTSSFTAKSDHCILLMDSDPVVDNGPSRRGGDYFRYDNCWATESACIDKVHTVWSFTAGSAIDKLSAVGGALRTWQHNRRVNSTKRIGELQRFLDSLIRGPLPPPTLGCKPRPPGGARWAPWRKRISPTGSKWRAVGKFQINGIGGATGYERYRIPRAWSAEGQGNAWAVLPMTPLPSSLYRARFLWSGLCIARQVRALAMPSRWGEFVTPTRPTTRGFGHVDARSRWLCATRLDNGTPNTGRPCVATILGCDNVTPNTGRPCVAIVLGCVSRPSNVRASDLIKSQWVLLLCHLAHPCPDPTPLKRQQQQ
ncbi:hypothetical protein GQ457_12G013390 [Hibiscus cannabinus]